METWSFLPEAFIQFGNTFPPFISIHSQCGLYFTTRAGKNECNRHTHTHAQKSQLQITLSEQTNIPPTFKQCKRRAGAELGKGADEHGAMEISQLYSELSLFQLWAMYLMPSQPLAPRTCTVYATNSGLLSVQIEIIFMFVRASSSRQFTPFLPLLATRLPSFGCLVASEWSISLLGAQPTTSIIHRKHLLFSHHAFN